MTNMDLRGKKVLVVGLARTGLAAVNFLLEKGARVVVTDLKERSELAEFVDRLKPGATLRLGEHRDGDFNSAELIVLSPGVPRDLPLLRSAAERGAAVWSEVELAYRFIEGRVLGVTGSNGKTTTTALIGEIFKAAGRPHTVAGNIGLPLISQVHHSHPDHTFIVELSSFQLEAIECFRCQVSLFLNLSADHLDRHASLEAYGEAKANIFRNQLAEDFAVVNADDPLVLKMARGRARRVLFSRRRPLPEGICVEDGQVWARIGGDSTPVIGTRSIRLRGLHNLENVLAATAAGWLSGIDPESMAKAFREFAGVEHRLEFVASLDGVDFYNDSKATNVDAALTAIRSFRRPLLMIMGGLEKGGDFRLLEPEVRRRVRKLFLIGEAAERIEGELGRAVPSRRASSLEEAVTLAFAEAGDGEVVLLAPGCASFDMFDNYEHRGRVFKRIVSSLKSTEGAAR